MKRKVKKVYDYTYVLTKTDENGNAVNFTTPCVDGFTNEIIFHNREKMFDFFIVESALLRKNEKIEVKCVENWNVK